MLCRLLLNSCSFNEVQPKDKLFFQGFVLARGKRKCALQAELSRSRNTRCLTKDICRMGVVDGLFSYAEDMTVERSFIRQSSDPESLWNHIRVLTKIEGSFFYSAIFVN